MTDDEIEVNALSDPDNPSVNTERLARMRPVPNAREIRQRPQFTPIEVSTQSQIPIGTLRDWEQGVRQPDSTAKTLLRVIKINPDAVLQALDKVHEMGP